MKTSELEGVQLDYWVARAEGWHAANGWWWEGNQGRKAVGDFKPSTDWAQGGPLIEKHRLNLLDKDYLAGTIHAKDGTWMAYRRSDPLDAAIFGATPLQAICRAVVRTAFGDEVPDT